MESLEERPSNERVYDEVVDLLREYRECLNLDTGQFDREIVIMQFAAEFLMEAVMERPDKNAIDIVSYYARWFGTLGADEWALSAEYSLMENVALDILSFYNGGRPV